MGNQILKISSGLRLLKYSCWSFIFTSWDHRLSFLTVAYPRFSLIQSEKICFFSDMRVWHNITGGFWDLEHREDIGQYTMTSEVISCHWRKTFELHNAGLTVTYSHGPSLPYVISQQGRVAPCHTSISLHRRLAAFTTYPKVLTNSNQRQVPIYLVLRGCMLLLYLWGNQTIIRPLMLSASMRSHYQVTALSHVFFLSLSFLLHVC